MNMRLRKRGFSLVELIASMVVLSILGLVIVRITGAIRDGTALSNRAADAAGQARVAFQRIGIDLEALVRRPDVDFEAQNASTGSGANQLLFLAAIRSPGVAASNNRPVSTVAYRVDRHSENRDLPCLIRAGKAAGWKAETGVVTGGFFGLKNNGLPVRFSDAIFPSSLIPQTGDFDVLAPGVIRMVVGYQLYPDDLPVSLASGAAPVVGNGKGRGQIVYSPPMRRLIPLDGGAPESYVELSRVAALVVGLVSVDLNSLRIVNAAQISDLAGLFPEPGEGVAPAPFWAPLAASAVGNSTVANVPQPVKQAVRVSECFFPINPYPAPDL